MEKDDLGELRRLLEGRFRIDCELGRGGFATVYRVWNPRLERAEALKVLAPGRQADEDFPHRFNQEVLRAASLEHPSIVKVYDFGEVEGICWYSMQLVVGQTLSDHLVEGGPIDEKETARIAVCLLDALEYSHGRGIVHRDIKPENIILDLEARPFLMDFGVAKVSGSLVKTQTGFLLGTPSYVAPEQAQGKPLDGRADLYALGVTLYKATSGTFPFQANEPLQAVVLRLTQPPRPLADARPGIDPAFAAIVMRALEREPEYRWRSARSMRDALEGFLSGRPVPAETADRGDSPRTEREGRTAAPAAPRSFATVRTSAQPGSEALASGDPASQSSRTSYLGVRPRRTSRLLPATAAAIAVLAAIGGGALVIRSRERVTAGSPVAAAPVEYPTAVPPSPVPATSSLPEATRAADPAPTPASLRVSRPTRAADPEPPSSRRPVTSPERLTPEPPLSDSPPAACSGVTVALVIAVDAEGNIVGPRALRSDAPPECDRYVLEALPRWKWRPALDATGAPVLSRPLGISVQLP